jgi:acetamidase/formamidase
VIHELPLERRNLHGHFSRDLPLVLTVDPGDSVRIDVPNAGWSLASRERFAPRVDRLDDGHPLAGPIEVRGARAGQALVVAIAAGKAIDGMVALMGREHGLDANDAWS